ncbi:MAG: TMEM143 family protein [Scytonema sp. PMC 1069.18]|nr:TMEM143 family protein [Scytonema sp. PMC 1069.18]MEC4885297.1 TMEM143 family protein [Scytonema sp. PMC 1070.18]
MAVHENREAFIPFRRSDIIQLCVEDGQLDAADAEKFKNFCQILSAYYHFRFHKTLEIVKDNYVPFNPNTDIQPLKQPTTEQCEEMETKVVDAFKYILERANYIPLPDAVIQQSLATKSLIDLKTEIDFEDFDKSLFYYRGDTNKTIPIKELNFRQKEKTIKIFEQIVLLIKFKEENYFLNKKPKNGNLRFVPGKMYIYFYKNIPQSDIDLLFPNVTTSMTWKDRLLFGVPAVGTAIPLLLKAVPNVLLLIAAILLVMNASSLVEALHIEQSKLQNVMPILVATLSLTIGLGGFAVKQYTNYKNKKIKFQKEVTETLFFKNLANNDSVFQLLTDIAEEEECKEIILAYYHLLTSPAPLTPEQLDSRIETWMEKKLGAKINFDLHGPLNNLAEIHASVMSLCEGEEDKYDISLLSYDEQGFCRVLPLEKAMTVIDRVWDNVFRYNDVIV